MCVEERAMGRKDRVLFSVANFALAAGLILWNFRQDLWPASAAARDGLEAVCGFLLGFSIAVNLHLAYLRRRRKTAQKLEGQG